MFDKIGSPKGGGGSPDFDNFIFGPKSVINELYNVFGVKPVENIVSNTVPCKAEAGTVRPDIVLYVGKKEDGVEGATKLVLKEQEYIFQVWVRVDRRSSSKHTVVRTS